MQYVIETRWDDDAPVPQERRFYGFFSFKEGANHAGEKLTQEGGLESDRLFEVHAVGHPGPRSLSEWLLMVRRQIEDQLCTTYNVNDDKFYETWTFEDEDDRANAAYKGAKIAMQLLEVQ